VSSHPRMVNFRLVLRPFVFALLLALFTAAHVSVAYGQTFTLTPSALSPSAGIDPGGSATATINVQGSGGFNSAVSLTCTVTSSTVTSDLPTCLISPSTVTPDAIAGLTLSTIGSTPSGTYTITVTGTSGSIVVPAQLFLNVIDVEPDYTLTVLRTISPTTVNAGNGAEATVTVTPLGTYTGTVTLSCLSVTPTVIASPICAFNPPSVQIGNSVGTNSILTVSTYGPTNNSKLWSPREFYAFAFIVPGLALAGFGVGGGRRKKMLWIFMLMAVASSLLLLPSCGNTSGLNNNNSLVTPKNTYTFTLTGVDTNGVAPSNSTSNNDQATVSLTVN
jgi:hypothetical protein